MKKLSVKLLAIALGINGVMANVGEVVVDDRALMTGLDAKVGKHVDDKLTIDAKQVNEQLKRAQIKLQLPVAGEKQMDDLYGQCVDGVGIITSVYKCGKCDKWHRAGCATCWVLTEDGVMVTNYHVFANKTQSGWGVLTRDGRVSPVCEVLAADKETDVAIFRVKGAGFKPLSLGGAQEVGGEVSIIAHPDGRFFTYTNGKVSRYYKSPNQSATWMAVTAEFARGSSGGPVMDECGNVVGMVSNTQSIYYPSQKKEEKMGPFQMVIRNCVPVSAIRKLIAN